MNVCQHPNMTSFHTCFISHKEVWLVMPLYEGGAVSDLMRRRFPNGIHNEIYIATILMKVLETVHYLHKQGYIHRDVKASNILLDAKGDLHLSDFGICAILKEGPNTLTFTGTLCWMAPEVLVSEQGYDYKADIWSIGIMALELAEGRVPYSDLAPLKVNRWQNIADHQVHRHERAASTAG
jgi:serine/threonine-protein kinase OSR1/STK39